VVVAELVTVAPYIKVRVEGYRSQGREEALTKISGCRRVTRGDRATVGRGGEKAGQPQRHEEGEDHAL
jgi:hypothetical protein